MKGWSFPQKTKTLKKKSKIRSNVTQLEMNSQWKELCRKFKKKISRSMEWNKEREDFSKDRAEESQWTIKKTDYKHVKHKMEVTKKTRNQHSHLCPRPLQFVLNGRLLVVDGH